MGRRSEGSPREVEAATAAAPAAFPDRDAVLGALWVECHSALFVQAVRSGLSAPDADDAIQLTFGRLAEGWSRFDGRSAKAWLYQVFLYELLTWQRATARRRARGPRAGEPVPEAVAVETADDDAVARQLLAAVMAYRATLSAADAAIFDRLNSHDDDALIAELAALPDAPATRTALRKRRERLRRYLATLLAERGYL